ncbi:MAG: hypothetical protein HZA93_18650 [Verrucomicrobia bacterium]|nr:hypothetical protein [Verrucomicrobiota bacterium]
MNINITSRARGHGRMSLLTVMMHVVFAIALSLSSGCALFHGPTPATEVPQFARTEPPPIQRVDMNRTARDVGVDDRTSFSLDDAIAKARLVVDKGSPADFRVVAKLLAPFDQASRPWHAEDQARVARYQILVGLAANDEACITAGAGNLAAARAGVHGVIYEHEATLLFAAHARLGWPRPNIAPTRLSNAMLLFAPSSNTRRFVEDLRLAQVRGGNNADLSAIERNVQEAVFDELAAWVKGQPTKEALADLLQTAAMTEYRGVRVVLPTTSSDPDIFSARLLVAVVRELGADI